MRCVWTTVSISVARTMRARIEYDESARTNSVRSSGTRGSLESRPDDDLDVRPLLERLRDPATPVGAQAGDEDTHRVPQPNQTLRRFRSMSYSASCTMRRMRSDSSITRLRE